jgi:CheY-specific phosphatase CheX
LLVLIYFTPDALTKAHFAALNKMDVQNMDAQAFTDAISECGNICCGSLNRELAIQFPHVGMSTPNIIDRRCARYLGALGSTHQQHFDIAIPQGPQFHASLCISEFEDLDFDIQISETQSSGELEMF